MPVIRFCTTGGIIRRWISFLLLPFLLSACFSGPAGKQSAREKQAAKTNAPDAFRLSQITVPDNATYNSVLDQLDRSDLQNIDHAITIYSNNKADSLSRDSMLITLNEFMNGVMQEYYAGKLTGNRKLMDQFENRDDHSEASKLTTSLASHGIKITYRDNDFYLEPDLAFVTGRLEKVLTTASRSYLQIKINLSNGNSDAKNQRLTPVDSLAHQIITWEDFILRYPNYVLKDEISAQYTDVLAAYLSGIESLPLFDADTKMLNPVYQASYLHFIENYPNRESARQVKKFYDLLVTKGFKYDDELDSFLSQVNFSPLNPPQ